MLALIILIKNGAIQMEVTDTHGGCRVIRISNHLAMLKMNMKEKYTMLFIVKNVDVVEAVLKTVSSIFFRIICIFIHD